MFLKITYHPSKSSSMSTIHSVCKNSKIMSDNKLGHTLITILRHTALNHLIAVGKDGYVRWEDMMTLEVFVCTLWEQVIQVVNNNDKQRFSIKIDPDPVTGIPSKYIRANQGHSFPEGTINAFQLLIPITPYNVLKFPLVLHGCSLEVWKLIDASAGLNRMGRNHIHMAQGLPEMEGVISGMRANAEVVIQIDIDKAMGDSIPFFVSANGVVLSPGVGDTGTIPSSYFMRVTNRLTGDLLMGH